MGDEIHKTIDESKVTEESTQEPGVKSVIPPTALSGLKRTLTEKELESKGVQKLILDRNDQLEKEIKECKHFKDKFHDADKRAAIAENNATKEDKFKDLFTFTMTVGGASLGAAITSSTIQQGALYGVSGFILVIGGYILSRRKNEHSNK